MFRMWVKEWENTHLLRDTVIIDADKDTRTHKVFHGLEKACVEFDLQVPIWLDSNVREFKMHSKTRFSKDNFTEDIPFDFLEIQIIEED